MTDVDIVGGVYREVCAFPAWDQIFGSGGRSAAALSGEHIDHVRLHTMVPSHLIETVEANLGVYGVDLVIREGPAFFEFEYLHPLATPSIRSNVGRSYDRGRLDVSGDTVICFGMMEADASVSAETCIYDPQSPNNPKRFSETESQTERLAIVCNQSELSIMAGDFDDKHAVQFLREESADVLVVKRGMQGVTVFTPEDEGHVSAFDCESSFLIGSGDVFTSAFGLAWGCRRKGPMEAAEYASKAVSNYCATRLLPILSHEGMEEHDWQPVRPMKGKAYLAGPFREIYQRYLINESRRYLRDAGLGVFSPVHDIGRGPAEKVVAKDLKAIHDCDLVFAVLNGSSPGTLFEVGYAVALGKPVYCLAENMRAQDIKLPYGAGCKIYDDLPTAIFKAATRA